MILYFRNSISIVQVHIENKTDQSESFWRNIVTLNSLLTIHLASHKTNSAKAENNQIQNSINTFRNKTDQ